MNTRITYNGFFANQILSDFYSPDRNSDSAMDTADKFRHDEWRVIGDASYAHHTRTDLYELGLSDPQLMVWIIEVIACMRYNRSMEMD
jgi:hypothetical protein